MNTQVLKTLETARLILRPSTMADVQDMFEYAQDPDVGPNACWPPHENVEAVQSVLQYLFDDLGVMLVSVYHYPHNIRSKRVIEKCGFTYEGTLRLASRIYNGTIHDDLCYSITREQYASKT